MEINLKQTEIVLVHLGQDIPQYVFNNLEHIADLFPNARINFVISDGIPTDTVIPNNVSIYKYRASEKLNSLFESKSIDLSFRKGFWRYSLERLFAIELVHNARTEHGLLYIESDVLLLPGFPLQEFSNLERIHWMVGDSDTDIASLVYFPNNRLTKQFTEDLKRYLQESCQPTDMKGLRSLREDYPNSYAALPIENSNFPALIRQGKNILQSSSEIFDGVFDAALIGMWLTGIDPRLTYGFKQYCATSVLQTEKSIIDPSIYDITLTDEGKLYFNFEHMQLQIYNLHIHSKSEVLLSKNWYNELFSLVKNANSKKTRTEFHPRVLAMLIVENCSNKTLKLFIYNSPPFHFIRIIIKAIRKTIR
jgi:hypothetical protein